MLDWFLCIPSGFIYKFKKEKKAYNANFDLKK